MSAGADTEENDLAKKSIFAWERRRQRCLSRSEVEGGGGGLWIINLSVIQVRALRGNKSGSGQVGGGVGGQVGEGEEGA